MKSLPPQANFGGAAILVAVATSAALGSNAVAVALLSIAVFACVAFVAQSLRLRDESRLVYRPVYARRQVVQRRIRSDD